MSSSMEPLHIKYRPKTFDEVVGQDAVVRSLKRVVADKSSRVFLFTGPSGTGKTTLARIVAAELGCAPADVEAIDAATNTGVDDMRAITSQMMYRPMGGTTRAIILDECFAAGTQVSTPSGFKAIEALRPKDKVLGVTGVQTVVRVIPRRIEETAVIKFTLAGKEPIFCSDDHPFLTSQGWRPARSLHGKTILSQEYSTTVPPQLRDMWDAVYEQRRGHTVLHKLLGVAVRVAALRGLQCFNVGLSKIYTTLLLPYMWEFACGAEASWRTSAALAGWNTKRDGAESVRESRNLGGTRFSEFTAFTYAQPNAFGRCATEDDSNQATEWHASDWIWDARNARGERSWSDQAAIIAALAYRWSLGVCGLYWTEAWAGWLAVKLQARYWLSRVAGRFRDRRWFALRCGATARSAEMQSVIRVRVDRPSLEELRNLEGYREGSSGVVGTVALYDLEIAEHPSFSVGGAVAHNCHMLSKNAWNSLLAVLEEPPDFVVWCLCTTEPVKVPKTIVTRCFPVELKPVASQVIEDLLVEVAGEEGLYDGPHGEQVIRLCARQADGSPRQALVYLAACAGATSVQEARELLRSAEESVEAVELARALVRGAPWGDVQDLLAKLAGTRENDDGRSRTVSPESIRQVVRSYVLKVVLNAKNDDAAALGIEILDAFSESCGSDPSLAPIVVACGHVLLEG